MKLYKLSLRRQRGLVRHKIKDGTVRIRFAKTEHLPIQIFRFLAAFASDYKPKRHLILLSSMKKASHFCEAIKLISFPECRFLLLDS